MSQARTSAVAVFLGLTLLSARASPALDATALLFSVSKSENRNFVQFAVRLDAQCMPAGDTPVFEYWRMLERGDGFTEPLLAREQPAYGIASQSVVARSDGYAAVEIKLRALSKAPLLVESWRDAHGECKASARTPIAGVDARLSNVHAVFRWPFGIARLLVSGWSLDGRFVRDARQP